MNYAAPARRIHVARRPPHPFKIVREIFATVQLFCELVIGLPFFILEKLGINLLPSVFQLNFPLCSVCICGSLLGIAASLGIGLGVGLGVGLNCRGNDDSYVNSTLANTTNGTTNSSFTDTTTVGTFFTGL